MRKIAAIATIVSLTLGISACDQSSSKNPTQQAAKSVAVGTVTVTSHPQAIHVELPGRSKAYLEAEVRPQVSGIITERSFKEGSSVSKGQSLYSIDSAPYNAAYLSAKASLAQAQANLDSAKALAQRSKTLVNRGAISKQTYDDNQAKYKVALAGIEVAKASVHKAKIDLDYTKVKAPIAGRIGQSSVTPGALVSAGQTQVLATIQQLDPINIDIAQSSTQLLRLKSALKQGQLQASDNADVELILEDGSVYSHHGTLQFAEVNVDPNTGSVTLRAEFPNPEGILLPGMYVRAVLNTGTDPKAIMIPQKAITRNSKGQAIAMIVGADNKVESRVVTTAEAIDNQWRITSGLKDGDQVIVDGLQKIRPGVVVEPTLMTVTHSQ
ncbi:efflux RND transporter periplasmic adaptor subunit [Photobacterium kishitanii]|uniref:Efflux RND transporter periplasmic adaptor subunit n=1 Tax=Photobacterium kishitanii TaxID=318456 RepID=A0A0B7J8H9_9GAMM|nr:efflux RND transporter periplasmic adaptor subunit [Photobacterium kishitanii]OBU25712.1 efflux transporter periplasmic adaptor subunit [Photobacterium kishitanii]OBU31017.1 efflux transporter periplasmic adaptor subunit [Photobacterium kishitanii]PSU15501.1 efflux RND transporter periplasmic adaptor subunit [Photobacterium kishitanii]PSU86627.1 efflux RND transporter periplasmic adaptor subunit [Photobacterium kishitanii]PSU88694.1 efflux RND transporter periplasmic adaptor subunit [Photob